MFKKFITKFISLCLTFTLSFSLCSSVSAVSIKDTTNEKIITALEAAEYIKNELGLKDVDFSKFTLGNPISAYDYTDNEFVKTRNYYPLLIDDVLTAFAIEVGTGSEVFYQISTGLVSEINSYISNSTAPIALVFDSNSSYVLHNNELKLLQEFPTEVLGRSTIATRNIANNSAFQLQNLSTNSNLNYVSNTNNARAPIYYECDIDFVDQGINMYVCWAACIACVVNCVTGTNLTTNDVAYEYYDGERDVFDYDTIPHNTVDNVLRDNYNLSYSHGDIVGGGVMLTNITNNYPMIGCFSNPNSANWHAAVIYAMNVSNGYTYIMDPADGFYAMQYSTTNIYQYVNSANVTYTLQCMSCFYW